MSPVSLDTQGIASLGGAYQRGVAQRQSLDLQKTQLESAKLQQQQTISDFQFQQGLNAYFKQKGGNPIDAGLEFSKQAGRPDMYMKFQQAKQQENAYYEQKFNRFSDTISKLRASGMLKYSEDALKEQYPKYMESIDLKNMDDSPDKRYTMAPYTDAKSGKTIFYAVTDNQTGKSTVLQAPQNLDDKPTFKDMNLDAQGRTTPYASKHTWMVFKDGTKKYVGPASDKPAGYDTSSQDTAANKNIARLSKFFMEEKKLPKGKAEEVAINMVYGVKGKTKSQWMAEVGQALAKSEFLTEDMRKERLKFAEEIWDQINKDNPMAGGSSDEDKLRAAFGF